MTLTDYTTLTAATARRVVEDALAAADRQIADIIAEAAPRTYANTLGVLDEAITATDDAYGIGGFMSQVHPDEAVRAAGAEA
mgnify:FL=1